MKLFTNLVIREFKILFTNSVILAVFIGAPLLYALLLGFVYKDAKVTDLPIVVVDMDDTPMSANIVDALNDNQYLDVAEVRFSTDGLHHLVVSNSYVAVVSIPDGFEADIQQKRHPEVNVEINSANMLTGNYATTGILRVLGTINVGIEIESLKKKGTPHAIAMQQYEAFQVTTNQFFNPASNYLLFLWPGMLGTIIQQVFLLTMALTFASEFESGRFRELLKHSKSTLYLLVVKSVPYWVAGILLWFPLIRVFFPFFDVPLVEAKLTFWLLTGLFIFALTFLGISVSIGLRSQLKATEILMIVAVPSFIISGQTWPISQMPEVIQYIASAIPLTHYLAAFRSLLLYKTDIYTVMPQIISLAVTGVICFAIAYILLHLKIKATLKREV